MALELHRILSLEPRLHFGAGQLAQRVGGDPSRRACVERLDRPCRGDRLLIQRPIALAQVGKKLSASCMRFEGAFLSCQQRERL
jgi:hypothetical protein